MVRLAMDPWSLSIYTFVGTFLITLPMSFVFHRYHRIIQQNWLNQWLNELFVAGGYLWFSIAMASMLYYNYRKTSTWNTGCRNIAIIYGINTVVSMSCAIWLFGPCLFERIEVFTGGHCSGDDSLTQYQCWDHDMDWVPGFDTSGHYFLLISTSMLTIDYVVKTGVLRMKPPARLLEAQTDVSDTKFRKVVLGYLLFLVGVWYFEYLITSIFFHTVLERIMGMIWAMAIPLLAHYFY